MAAQQRQEITAKRVALVIGNSAYKNVPQLRNPVSDAAAIGDMLKSAGFDVVEIRQNLANNDLRRTINNFYDTARNADIAVVYYAGHGIEVDGSNYIIPVDALLERDRDVYDEALSLDRILQSIEPARQLRLVLLDACRDNPFAKSMRRSFASRGGLSRGLARVDPDSPNTLIAFAAKAGSTADDGTGAHSPFTASLLKHLTVPGIDLRKALGLVRDEVISATGNRQEPFVFGSLGGADVSLVPAPVNFNPAVSVADIRADYESAERVGTMEAWDYFLAAHANGFYADLARAQRNKLASSRIAIANAVPGFDTVKPSDQTNIKVANLGNPTPAPGQEPLPGAQIVAPNVIAPGREPTAKEALDWDKVKDSTDQAALQNFIKRYPNSPLSITAQQRLDVLKRAAEEREAKARAEKEAAAKAAEEARIQAEQQKAELAAAKKREEEERRAKAAEAEQKAKAEAAEKKAAEARQKAEEEQKKAEAAAAKKREEEERRAKAAEAEQKAKAAAAEKKAAEEKQRAEEEQKKAELAAAAKKRDEEERRAKAAEAEQKANAAAAEKKAAEARQKAEAEQKKAEAAAAKKREEEERRAKAAELEQKAKAEAAEKKAAEEKQRAEEAERKRAAAELEALRAASEKLAKQAEVERKKAELAAAQEGACQKEQIRFDELSAKGSEGSGLDDLQSFSKSSGCDRLRPQVEALLTKFNAEAAKRAAAMPNSPELIRAAQTQLTRIGCFSGKADGVLATATAALDRYTAAKGSSSKPTAITQDVVADLTGQAARVCPLECKPGQTAKGEVCVANAKPATPATASRHKNDDEEDSPRARPRKPAHRQADRASQPQARQQAVAPSIGNAGGNGTRTLIGVGF